MQLWQTQGTTTQGHAGHHHPGHHAGHSEGAGGPGGSLHTPLATSQEAKEVQKVNAYLGAGAQGVCRAYGPR